MAIINDSNLTRKNVVADIKTMIIAFVIAVGSMATMFACAQLAAKVTGIH